MAAISDVSNQFLSWWGHELRGLLPDALFTMRRQLPRYVIGIEGGGGRLLDLKNSGHAAGPYLDGDVVPIAQVARDVLQRVSGQDAPEVGLRLRHAACFARRVELPASATRDFPRLLALDLERATPFKPRDVYSAFQIDPNQSSPGMATITQLVVKRSSVNSVIAELEGAGVRVVSLDCWSEDGSRSLPVDFLDQEKEGSGGDRRSYFWPKVLGAVAATQLAVAGYLAIDRHEAALAQLQEQSSQLKKKLQVARESNLRAQAVAAEIDNFRRVRAANASRVAAIEELTRLLPDMAWVTDLRIEGANVSISGLAKSAVSLIPTLERSPLFIDAVSTAPLTFDQREDKERFSMRVKLRGASMPDAKRPAEAGK